MGGTLGPALAPSGHTPEAPQPGTRPGPAPLPALASLGPAESRVAARAGGARRLAAHLWGQQRHAGTPGWCPDALTGTSLPLPSASPCSAAEAVCQPHCWWLCPWMSVGGSAPPGWLEGGEAPPDPPRAGTSAGMPAAAQSPPPPGEPSRGPCIYWGCPGLPCMAPAGHCPGWAPSSTLGSWTVLPAGSPSDGEPRVAPPVQQT